jgi:hypothetical protein
VALQEGEVEPYVRPIKNATEIHVMRLVVVGADRPKRRPKYRRETFSRTDLNDIFQNVGKFWGEKPEKRAKIARGISKRKVGICKVKVANVSVKIGPG